MEFKDRIRNYIAENILLGAADKPIGDDDSFLEQGLIDSTGILELVGFVEGEFGIEVTDDELIPDNFDSIEKLTAYLKAKTSSGSATRSQP